MMRYKTWVDRFSGDPSIVNKTFVLNDVSRTLIGIMPPRFGWGDADLWVPDKPLRAGATQSSEFPRYWFLLGHLKPGVTIREAQANFDVIAHRLSSKYPKDYPKHFTVEVNSLTDLVVGQFRTTLYIVLAAVGLLLLIGCGNVANLLLARATGREKEFAIRAVLGAGRLRLIRQLLVESLILALGGAFLGALIAWGGLKALVAAIPAQIIPAEAVIRLNAPVLAFTLCVAVMTALIFGLVPALQAARRDLNDPLRDSGKGTSGSGRHNGIAQCGGGAGGGAVAHAHGFCRAADAKFRSAPAGAPGTPARSCFGRAASPAEGPLQTSDQITSFYKPLLQRVKALPGVVDATETSTLPPYGGIRHRRRCCWEVARR